MRRTPPWLIALVLILAALVSACSPRDPDTLGPEEYRTASGATKTLGEVVQVLHGPPLNAVDQASLAKVLDAVRSNLHVSLQIETQTQADPAAVGSPLVTAEAFRANPEAAAGAASDEAKKREEVVTQEQTASWWQRVLQWGGWGLLGAVGLWVARQLGIPGIELLADPLIRKLGNKVIKPLEDHAARVEQTARTAAATVEGSMVGRHALLAIDSLLAKLKPSAQEDVAEAIGKLTQGQATTLEGLFRYYAQSHAVDSPTIDSTAVARLVDTIKDRMPTEGGLAIEVARALQPLLNKAA